MPQRSLGWIYVASFQTTVFNIGGTVLVDGNNLEIIPPNCMVGSTGMFQQNQVFFFLFYKEMLIFGAAFMHTKLMFGSSCKYAYLLSLQGME